MLQREHSAILSTFIKLPFVIKIFVLSILSGRLRQVLLYIYIKQGRYLRQKSFKYWRVAEPNLTVINFACSIFFNAFNVACWLFSKLNFQNILSGTLSECKMVWIQIRTDILSGLIWVQTKVTASKENRGSYMSALVLLNLLNKLGEKR